MKYLHNKSLFQLGTYLIVLLSIIFISEYFMVRAKLDSLDEAERKIDFVRSTHVNSQQVAMMIQRYHQKDEALATDIQVKTEEQDQLLNTLKTGGRIDGTSVFLKPLSRLPRITFDRLVENWEKYKESIAVLFAEDSLRINQRVQVDSSGQQHTIQTVSRNANYENAVRIVNTKWQVLSNSYASLISDLDDEVVAKQAG